MGLSETILAAMIGAIATVTTALFQIFTAFKARGKNLDVKPRKGSTMRSVLAVMALMIASAAGGFLYSELLRQRGGEDIRAMRQELRELRDLTAANVHERGHQEIPVHVPVEQPLLENAQLTSVSLEPVAGSAESVAYVPACRRSPPVEASPILNASSGMAVDCVEAEAQRIALCGTIPAAARVEEIQLFAQPDAVQQPWTQHTAAVEQDIGGARFTGKTFEYAQGADVKSVCVNFMHWSGQHPHIARILVQYRIGPEPEIPPAPAAAAEAAPVMTQTLINSEGAQAVLPQTASFAAPGAVE